MGGNGRVSGRPIDGGERVGGGRRLNGGEVSVDGGDPCWLSDVICKDGKEFILFPRVVFE